jgi:hypothetical protein
VFPDEKDIKYKFHETAETVLEKTWVGEFA